MNEPREHTRPLRDYRGETDRDAILTLGPVGPWKATITLTAMQLRGYHGHRFELAARWHGPPLPGSPPADRPVAVTDVWIADDLELARQVAHHVRDQLAAGQLPDMRATARELRARAGESTSNAGL